MYREPFLVAFRQHQWVLSHEGRQLGRFRFRASALKGAIESLYWSSGSREQADVLVLERNGCVYTAWKSGRDQYSVSR